MKLVKLVLGSAALFLLFMASFLGSFVVCDYLLQLLLR